MIFILIVVICCCCFKVVIHKCFLFLPEAILVLYSEYKLECVLKHTTASLGLHNFFCREILLLLYTIFSVRLSLLPKFVFFFLGRHRRFIGFSPPSSPKTASPWWKTEWRTCLWLNMVLHCCTYHMKHICFVNCFIYIRMKFLFLIFIPYCMREKKYSVHYFFRSMIPTGRGSRMTQEVGSSCSTPWLFFQTFWSFSLPSLNYTNNGFGWEKQHRNPLTYTVIDQRRGSETSLWKNRECAISFFPVAFYYHHNFHTPV